VQVAQHFLSENTLAVFGDCFTLDISRGKIGQFFSAHFFLAKSDVTFGESE
jgi:hypothetical protein